MNQTLPIGTAPIAQLAFAPPPKEPSVYLHVAIFLGDSGNTILGDETFRLVSFSGTESISEPFEYQLELHANDQWRPPEGTAGPWTVDQLLGRSVTFAVSLPETEAPMMSGSGRQPTEIAESSRQFREAVTGSGDPLHPQAGTGGLSFFNGIIASIDFAEPGVYHVTVKPALWQLTLSNRYTVLGDCSIRDALAQTLQRYKVVADFSALDMTATASLQDWLQAGESDFQFIGRLMGKARLFYYFRHTATSHVVVFGNKASYPDKVLPDRPLRYVHVDTAELGLTQSDVIVGLRYQQTLGISAVNARFVEEYEAWQGDELMFQHPLGGYSGTAGAGRNAANPFNLHKVYQHDCSNELTADLAGKTYLSNCASTRKLSGQAYCAAFRIGYQFRIAASTWAGGARVPVRPQLDERSFVLTKVEHQASMDGGYQNSFEATTTDGLVSPFDMEDTQQAAILAVVVAQDGKNQASGYDYLARTDFDPVTGDYAVSDGASDSAVSGAYVVLAPDWPDGPQLFVKVAANMQTVPSIGSLVLVARSSDETELPEMQQVVFAAGSDTVTPDGWTANSSVGSAHGTRYGDGLNITFGASSQANLSNAVNIITAAYSMSAPASLREADFSQGASYGFSTAEAAATTAAQNLPVTFGSYGNQASDLLSVNESFGSTFGRSIGKVQSAISDYGVGYSDNTLGTSVNYMTVTGTSYSQATHGGTVTNETTMQADSISTTTIDGVSNTTATHNGDVTNDTTINAASTTTTTHNGDVTNTTTINATSTTTTTHNGDVSNDTTINGSSTNSNMVSGLNSSFSMAALETSLRLIGNNTSVSVMGASEEVNIMAATLSVKIVGPSIEVDIHGPGLKFSNDPDNALIEVKEIDLKMPVSFNIVL